MPLGTDTLIPEHLLEKIEKKSDVLIAPTIPYGACQSLAPYPGTIDIDNEAVSYTHLTLPTKRIVEISVVGETLKKKTEKQKIDCLLTTEKGREGRD